MPVGYAQAVWRRYVGRLMIVEMGKPQFDRPEAPCSQGVAGLSDVLCEAPGISDASR
jgi:hypothetical protein